MEERAWRAVVDRLRTEPAFLAGALPHTECDLAEQLRTTTETALRVLVCRRPRSAAWDREVRAIAGHVGIRDADLDALLTAWVSRD